MYECTPTPEIGKPVEPKTPRAISLVSLYFSREADCLALTGKFPVGGVRPSPV